MEKKIYKGYDLFIAPPVANGNGRESQTILIYKDGKFIAGSYADTGIEDPIQKAQKKINLLLSKA